MEGLARRLRRIERASPQPAHSPPAPDRMHAPPRDSVSILGSSTRWGLRAPTDARSASRAYSDRCTREVQRRDSFAALVLPLIADKAVSLQGAPNSLESLFHVPAAKSETAASHQAERRRSLLRRASIGCARRCRMNW